MDSKQTRIVFAVILIVFLTWIAAAMVLGFREPAPPLSKASLQFDGTRAFRFTQEFVTRYPRRVLGSFESRHSTGYLQQQLKQMGYEISYIHFNAILAGRSESGRNVLAFKPGQTQEILAVLAHYDTAATTVQGAMDNGSGVGALLELARVFAGEAPRRSLLFVASDGAEWGMLGSLDLVANYPERQRVVCAISLDYVPMGDLAEMVLGTAGLRGGYTPPWLREISRAVIRSQNLPVAEPAGFQEHLQRALPYPRTDQGPFLWAGIPAVNLGGASTQQERDRQVFHSPQDRMENMKASTFEVYGKTAEGILRTIDELGSLPSESQAALRVKDDLYLPPSAVWVLHYLSFGPFLLTLYFHLMNHQKYLSPGRVWREGLEYLGVFLSLSLVYAAIVLFRTLRLLPRFSLFPGAVKDPVLANPRWGVLGCIISAGILAAVVFYFSRRLLLKRLPRPDFYISKSILMTLLLVIIFIALQYNSYWAVSFLVLPAWIWSMVGIGEGPGGRAANRISILAAGIVYYLVLTSNAGTLGLGWKIFWYEILAVSTGLYAPEGVFLVLAAFGVGIRFLCIQGYTREE